MKLINDRFMEYSVKYLKRYPSVADKLPQELEKDLAEGIIKVGKVFLLRFREKNYVNTESLVSKLESDIECSDFELDCNELAMIDYDMPWRGFYSEEEISKAFERGIVTSYRLADMLKPLGVFCVIHTYHYSKETKLISSWINFYKVRELGPHDLDFGLVKEDYREDEGAVMKIITY